MSTKGIDVSVWNGNIDFNKVKASGIDFVIIRAGYGNGHKDKKFEQNYQRAKAAGLHVGAYWYSYATSADGARKEARSCASVLAGKQFDYPVYFDIEEKKQLSKGKDFCSNLITAFCSELEKLGYFAGFYTSLSVLNNLVSGSVKTKYSAWVAQWASTCSYKGAYGLWQYSSKGSVPGINGAVDLDFSYKDFPEIIKSKGLNGYDGPVRRTPETMSLDEIARAVIDGKYGNGATRKKKLAAAGFDYAAVQKRVNELLK